MARETLPGWGKDNPKIPQWVKDNTDRGTDPDRFDNPSLYGEVDDEGVKVYQPGKSRKVWKKADHEEYGDYTYEEDLDQAYPPVYEEEDYGEDFSDPEEDLFREGANKKKVGALVGLAGLALLAFLFFRWRGGPPKTLVKNEDSGSEVVLEESQEKKEDLPEVVWEEKEGADVPKEANYEADKLREPNLPNSVKATRELSIHYPDQSIEGGSGNPEGSGDREPSGGPGKPDPEKKMAKGNRLLAESSENSRISSNLPLASASSSPVPFSLNFSGDPDLSRQVFVQAGKDGYDLYSRHEASFQGLTPADLLSRLRSGEGSQEEDYPSKLTVRVVSPEEAQAIAGDPDLESLVETWKGVDSGLRLVLYRKAREGAMVDEVFSAMDTPPLTLDRVEKLVQEGTEVNEEGPSEEAMSPEEEWEKLTDKLLDDAFRVEWEYNLPLYAAGPFDRLGIEDLRKNKPTTEPAYEVGLVDLDRDGHPEYLIHASMRGETRENVQGYWAILTPSKAGLLVQACYPYGNGDMIYKKEGLVLTSQSRGKNKLTFTIYRTAYPETAGQDQSLTFYQPEGLGQTLTYEDLKDDYKGAYLVPYKGGVYLASRKDYDAMMNLAENAIQGGVQLALSGGPSEDATIVDVNRYLQRNFQEFPLSSAAWSKAVPLSRFEGRTDPIRYEDLASEG